MDASSRNASNASLDSHTLTACHLPSTSPAAACSDARARALGSTAPIPSRAASRGAVPFASASGAGASRPHSAPRRVLRGGRNAARPSAGVSSAQHRHGPMRALEGRGVLIRPGRVDRLARVEAISVAATIRSRADRTAVASCQGTVRHLISTWDPARSIGRVHTVMWGGGRSLPGDPRFNHTAPPAGDPRR